MKSVLCVLATLLLLQTVSADLAAPKTCEDVLTADTCNKLREIAKTFHERASIVNDAIQAALAKHISNAKDILNFVKNYLIERAANLRCEDVLTADQCEKLTDLAARFKVSTASLKRDIEEAIAEGLIQGNAIYQKTVEILLSKINNLSCENLIDATTCQKINDFASKIHASSVEVRLAIIDAYSKGLLNAQDFLQDVIEFLKQDITCESVLTADQCTKLREVAKTFHEKVGIVNEAIQAALEKHITGLTDTIDFVKNYLVERATNFKCEDVLKAEQCQKLVDIAGKFKVSVANLTRDIEEAIADGLVQGKAIYQKSVEILLSKINNLSCENLIDATTCQKIKDFGTKVHASSQDVRRAIIDAYSKGLVKAKDFYQDAIDYLTNEISCEKVLSAETCDTIQKLADKFGASFDRVNEILREAVANGATKITDLYKAAIKYIMDKWMGLTSYRLKRSLSAVQLPDVQKSIADILSKLEAALNKSKGKVAAFVTYLKALLARTFSEAAKSKAVGAFKAALGLAKDYVKELITKSVDQSRVELQKVAEQIKELLKKLVEPESQAYFMQDLELMDAMTTQASNKILSQMSDDAEKELNKMIDDVANDAEVTMNVVSHDIRQKRALNSWINDEIIAVLEKMVNKVFGAELRTKIDTWIETHKTVVIAAVKEGSTALFTLIKNHWADLMGIIG